jgi:glycosyltransferase 2 family protein
MTKTTETSSPTEPASNSESEDLTRLDEERAIAVSSGVKPIWLRLVKYLITVVVVAAVAFAARGSIQAWHQQSLANRITLADVRYDWLAVSALTYAASLVPASLVLRRALAALHQPVELPLVVAAQLVGHLGKYVPGKAMVIVLRASILSRGQIKVSLKLSALAVIIETLNLIAVGATLALLLVVILDTPAWIRWTSGLMAVGAVVGTWPPVLAFFLSRRLRLRSSGVQLPNRSAPLPLNWTYDDLIASWFWCTVSWVFTGLSMTAVVLALAPMQLDQSLVSLTLICSAAAMLAFVAGFASLLPGGAGVREMVLATLLAPVIGPGLSLLAAIVARLVQVGVESIIAGAIWIALTRWRTDQADQLPS